MPIRSPAAGLIPHLRRAVLASDVAGLTDGQLLGEFLRSHDEAAFAALVRRHAAMVFGVCRRVVGDPHLAEDAFQAAFLVLARRAASVWPREQVGSFLYGVAYRTALKARSVRARRRTVETQVDPMPHPEARPADPWPDLQSVIDAELARLPDKLRLPVVLCDLEGRSQREVARQLGLPPATLANRLASARRTLAKRLTDRGVTLSGGALAAALSTNAASAAVPQALTASAFRAAGVAASGAGSFPAHVVQLSEGVMRMMMLSKLKGAAVALLTAAILAGGFGVGTLPAAGADEKAAPAAKTDPVKPALGPNLTDEEFLKRICLDLRGDAPTRIEMDYFLADMDAGKRKKVVGWLTDGAKLTNSNVTSIFIDPIGSNPNVVWNEVHGNKFVIEQSSSLRPWVAGGNTIRAAYLNELLPWTAGVPARLDDLTGARWMVTGLDVNAADGRYAVLSDGSVRKISYFTSETDDAFLRRICQDARGTPPTRIELEYFLADTEPKKREKLVDLLLKDPEIAKKVGDGWKQKVLGQVQWMQQNLAWLQLQHQPLGFSPDYGARVWNLTFLNQAKPDRYDTLIAQLLANNRHNDHVFETLTAAILGRLPTESEKAFALTNVGKATDKPAAWKDLTTTLTQTKEARQYADDLKSRTPGPEKR